MATPTEFTKVHEPMRLGLFEDVAPFTRDTWQELKHLGVNTLGDINGIEQRLSAQAESDIEALELWLRTTGSLPLRQQLRRSTLAAIDAAIGASRPNRSTWAMLHLLDDPVTLVLQSFQVPLSQIEQALLEWARSDWATQGAAPSVADELERMMGPDKRGPTILVAHQGLRQRYKMKLHELGDQLGISRERVRQLEQRARLALAERVIVLPQVHHAYRILVLAGQPLPLSHWHGMLPKSMRPATKWELRAVHCMHEVTGAMPVTWVLHEGEDWAVAGKVSAKELMQRLTATASRIRSVTNRFAMPPSLKPIPKQNRELANLYFLAHPEWFACSPSGWWVSLPHDDIDGAKDVRYMLSALGPLSVADLRGGLRRVRVAVSKAPHRRMAVPPVEQLAGVLRTAQFKVDRSQMVHLGDRNPGRRIGKRATHLIEAFRKHGKVMTWNDAHRLLGESGGSVESLKQLISRSPLVTRLGRGRYALRGSEVAAAEGHEVDYVRPDALREALVFEGYWTFNQIELCWRVHPHHSHGRYPSGSIAIPTGRYLMKLKGRRWKIWVEEGGWIRGLGGIESRARRAGMSEMVVRIDIRKRTVTAIWTASV